MLIYYTVIPQIYKTLAIHPNLCEGIISLIMLDTDE